MTKDVDPKQLDELLHDSDTDEVLVDVRTKDEYESGHIPEAENIPLSTIDEAVDELKNIGTVYVSCGTGGRSEQACKILEERGVNVVNLHGGLNAWVRAGLHTIRKNGKRVIPIIRQVMITVGLLILIGEILDIVFSPIWKIIPLIVGSGLLFAGLTGTCFLSKILAKMPWNR